MNAMECIGIPAPDVYGF